MPTKRDARYESDDQGGEPPCFMCLLDEDGLLPDQQDTPRTHPHAQNDRSTTTQTPLTGQLGGPTAQTSPRSP